jgi:hypothetical protein
MTLKYSGSEKGLKLNPQGVEHYSQLLKETSLQIKPEGDSDPTQIVYSIADRNELLENQITVNIVINESLVQDLPAESVSVAILVKESSSRSCEIAYQAPLNRDNYKKQITLDEELFKNFSYSSSIFIDVVVYDKSPEYGFRIQALKRFSLSFASIAGLWSIEAVDPQYFVSRGGGVNTMFITEMEFDGEEDLTMKPAIDVVKVFLNKNCVIEFGRLTNKLDTSGDVLRRFFVHSIILKISQQLLNVCSSYPRQADDGSVAAKILDILSVDSEADYFTLQDEVRRDPERLSLRIQNKLQLTSSIAKYTGKK